jgi:hypothetical protein
MLFPCPQVHRGQGGERMQLEGGSERVVARLFHVRRYEYRKVN